jgi:predicted transcriptional regulator
MPAKSDKPLQMRSFKLDPDTIGEIDRLAATMRTTRTGVLVEAVRRLARAEFGPKKNLQKSTN